MLRADKVIVRQDSNGFQSGTAFGNPVYYRQKRDGVDEYLEAWGQRAEYDARADMLQLFERARVKRGNDDVRGNYISYDGKTEVYTVVGGGKPAAGGNNPEGRVRAVIQPKSKTPAAPAPAAPLKPAGKVENPREE